MSGVVIPASPRGGPWRLFSLHSCILALAASVFAVVFLFSALLLYRSRPPTLGVPPPPFASSPPRSCADTRPYAPAGWNSSALDPCALPALRSGGGGGGPFAGAARSAADVARRARFAAACASLHPYSANASEGPPLETRRGALVAHGARVHAALTAWLAPLQLPPPQHIGSLGYTGPFLEDMWAAEFLTPVRYEGSPPLEAPYDAELFHPFVPLFIPWERLFVADSIRAGAAAHKREAKRVAIQARQIARLNETYQRSGGGGGGGPRRLPSPLALPTAAHAQALAAFPHLASLDANLLRAFLQFLNATLRDDVAYVTVCQRPAGPWAEGLPQPLMRRALWRTVVLSAGGGGHVALPLLGRELPLLRVAGASKGGAPPPPPPPSPPQQQQPWPPLEDAPAVRAALARGVEVPPPLSARFALGFQGSARSGARARATAAAAAALGPAFAVNKSRTPHPLEWVPPLVAARLVFAPRGVGATSFRLFEALQLGVPPVYVFDGPWPWLPYAHPAELPPGAPLHPRALPRLRDAYPAADLPPPPRRAPPWPALAYVLSEGAFNASLRARLLPEVHGDAPAAEAAWRAKRAAIEGAREAHFTYAGVAARVREWLADPWAAELFCARPVPPFWDAWVLPPPCCAAAGGNASAAPANATGECRQCGDGDGPGPRRYGKISEVMKVARERVKKGVRVAR